MTEEKKEEERLKRRRYYEENKEEIKAKAKAWAAANREKRLEQAKAWRAANRDKIYERNRKSYWKDIEASRTRGKTYYEENKEKVNAQLGEARKTYLRAKYNEYQNQYVQARCARDPNFRLRTLLTSRLAGALRGKRKSGSAVRDMGCSIEELRQHLESKFVAGMSWENWGRGAGKWNIDHILPLASFDLTDREQVLKAVHFTNLQPLWAADNIRKGCKVAS